MKQAFYFMILLKVDFHQLPPILILILEQHSAELFRLVCKAQILLF